MESALYTCAKCQAGIEASARFCDRCGAPRLLSSAESRSLAASRATSLATTRALYALWGPTVAAFWSFFLTPMFGAAVHALNWRAMGQLEELAYAKRWVWLSLMSLLVAPALLLTGAAPGQAAFTGRSAILVTLLAWYYWGARRQIRRVAVLHGSDFPRRSWWGPILAAFGGLAIYAALLTLLQVAVAGE